MSKKNKMSKVKSYSSDSDEMMRMIKVLGGVVGVLLIFYLVVAFFNGEFKSKEYKKVTEIQNVEIIAGNTFNRNEDEYYVLMYNFEDTDALEYSNVYQIYENYFGSKKLFLVDLNKKFSAKYLTENESEVNGTSIETMKVVNGTLIHVVNGQGTNAIVGLENIKNELLTR